MSHMIDTMMFSGEKPWHGLGTELPDSDLYDIEAGLKAAGMGWEVELAPLYEKSLLQDDNGNIREIFSEIDERKLTRRSDNGLRLGTVGPFYKPLQNAEAFSWFKPFLESREAALHTAGSLDEGRRVWILAKLNLENSEIVKGDEIAKFLLLSNSHDGTIAVRVGFTPIRVVCANTLGLAHRDKSDATKLIRIKHHKNVQKTLEAVREVINVANQEFEASAEQYRFLAKTPISAADLQKYVKIVLKVDDEEKLTTRTGNILADIIQRYATGKHQDIEGVRGTWWAAYNSVNEWLNHSRGHKADTRMKALWFGDSAVMNQTALETALELANAA